MGQSRTLGAVRSYFSKNRKRLDLDRIAEEAQVRGGAEALPMQQVCTCHEQALLIYSQTLELLLAIKNPKAACAWTLVALLKRLRSGLKLALSQCSRWRPAVSCLHA